MRERQKKIIETLESKGHYILAENLRQIIASKDLRRKSKIKAINIAAELRDQLEKFFNKLLQKLIGEDIKEITSLVEVDFDKLEDKFTKILTEYLEFKTNQEYQQKYQQEPQYKSEMEIEPVEKEKILDEKEI